MGLFSKKDKDQKDEVVASDEVKTPAKSEVKVKVAKEKGAKPKTTVRAERVILSPWVTEKATNMQTQDKYSFVVDPKVNKIMVASAVYELYGVKPIKVNLVKVSGKVVRYGRISGTRKDWAKAIVTLKKGDKISIFESV